MTVVESILTSTAGDLSSDAALRVDRVAGLAADRLPAPLVDADRLAERLDDLTEEIAASGERLSDVLFALVPRLDEDKALRRAVLALRRSTRTAEPAVPDGELVARITAALDRHGQDGDVLVRWARRVAEHGRLVAELNTATADGVARASRTLEQLRADPDLMGAVADASCVFAASVGDAPLPPTRHTARSMLAYATRAGLKTSPFSGLTTVGVVGSRAHGAVTTIAHSYASAWLDAVARDETAMLAMQFEALDTGGVDAGQARVGVPELMESDDFIWRRTAITHLRQAGTVLTRLQRLGRVPARRLLAEIGGSDPFASYRRMLDSGLLRPVAPWAYGERDALTALTTHLRATVPRHPIVATLTGILDEAHEVAGTTGRERGQVRVQLRDRAQAALRERGTSPARSRFDLYVDVAAETPVEPFPDEVSTEIHRLSSALDRHVRRSTAHDAIVAHFVAAYGVGGTAPSAWEWLLDAGADQSLCTELRSPAAGRADVPLGRSQPEPTAAIAVQRVHGESLVVVNQTLDGQGGIATRFARLHDGPEGIAARVAARAARLSGGSRAVELVPAADVNSMQSAASGTLPRLRVPTDAPGLGASGAGASAEVSLAASTIRHDPRSDSLELLDVDQQPFVLFYLGLVPPHLLSGTDRVLSVLANPWCVPRLGAPVVAALASPTAIVAQPRRVDGRVVLRRATWSVPRTELFDVVDDDACLLRTVGRWRRRHGIPAETFVRLVRATAGFDAVARKPVPLDLRSPHSLRRLAAMLGDDVIGLEVVEALPDTTQLAPSSPSGEPRAVEHLVFLSWTRERAHPVERRS